MKNLLDTYHELKFASEVENDLYIGLGSAN
mgnify:FL=1